MSVCWDTVLKKGSTANSIDPVRYNTEPAMLGSSFIDVQSTRIYDWCVCSMNACKRCTIRPSGQARVAGVGVLRGGLRLELCFGESIRVFTVECGRIPHIVEFSAWHMDPILEQKRQHLWADFPRGQQSNLAHGLASTRTSFFCSFPSLFVSILEKAPAHVPWYPSFSYSSDD